MHKKAPVLDIFLLLLFIAILIKSLYHITITTNLFVVIDAPNQEYIYPLNSNNTYVIKGSLGYSTIIVENNSVRFEKSPCRNKTCILAGKLTKPGSWAACMPNKIFIKIESSDKYKKLDATAS